MGSPVVLSLSECLVDGAAAVARLTRCARHRDALSVSGDHFSRLLGGEGWRAVSTLAGCLGCGDALLPPLVDDGALELRECAEHLEYERGGRFGALGGAEDDALLDELHGDALVE